MSAGGQGHVARRDGQFLRIDGGGGHGIPTMQLAFETAIEATSDQGISVSAISNLGHTGRHGAFAEQAAEALLAGADGADIIITHSPPRGIADVVRGLGPVGSVAIGEAIARVQPALAVCGHIHDCWGQEGMVGATRVVNLGPTVNWFEV